MNPAAQPVVDPPAHRPLHHRMSCPGCDVAWTGPASSVCWFCSGPGVCAPPPSIWADPNEV